LKETTNLVNAAVSFKLVEVQAHGMQVILLAHGQVDTPLLGRKGFRLVARHCRRPKVKQKASGHSRLPQNLYVIPKSLLARAEGQTRQGGTSVLAQTACMRSNPFIKLLG